MKYRSPRFFSCEQFPIPGWGLRRTVILSLDNCLREARRTTIRDVLKLQLTKEVMFR